MAGLDPAIHVAMSRDLWTWMPATSAGITIEVVAKRPSH